MAERSWLDETVFSPPCSPIMVFRHWRSVLLFVCCLVVCGTPFSANAQPDSLSAESTVSMITILPGEPVYSMFGHSAIRIQDPGNDLDRLYNYGTFDFSDPLFIPKFAYGHLRYYLSVVSYPAALRVYERQERPVIQQTLNLSHEQRTALYRFLQANARPENRYYQYDFFFDNCSTRVRDALEKALGNAVQFPNRPRPIRSFRQLLDPYAANLPLVDLSFDLALGTPADRVPTAREAHFLPDYLFEAFDNARVRSRDTTQSLVARTDTVQWVAGYTATPTSFRWPIAGAWLFLVLTVGWTGWQATTDRTPGERGDALLLAFVGTIGAMVCFLWFIAAYEVTDSNWNLAWAWPTHLVAAAVLLWRPGSKYLRIYLGVTAGSAVLVAVIAPLLPQPLHEAVYPLVLALAVRAGWRALRASATPLQRVVTPGLFASSGRS